MESLLGGISRKVSLGFTSGLGHISLLFGLVADGPASDSEEVARTGLAGAAVVCQVSVGKACKLEAVVRARPQSLGACRWCHGVIEVPLSVPACGRPRGMLGRSHGCSTLWKHRDAWRRPLIRGCPVNWGRRPWPPRLGGGEVMCASPARKPWSIGRDEGLESIMPYLRGCSARTWTCPAR
jgi:hypothetical protein